MEICYTTEKAVNINENTPESEEETESADNAKNTEKLGNTIIISDISISILSVEKLKI